MVLTPTERISGIKSSRFINRTIIVEASSTLVKVTSLLCKNIPYTAPVKNALSVNPGKGVPVVSRVIIMTSPIA